MNRGRIMLAAGAAIVAAMAPSALAAPAHATGIATAILIKPLSVVAVADMDFGTITHLPGASGTVTVSPGTAGASFAGGASAVCAGSVCADAHAARFSVSGEPQRIYAIRLPASVLASGASANAGTLAPSLAVTGLTVRATSGANQPSLNSGGTDQFEVGGTITLPADLPPARYRANFAVIVSYI